MTHLIDDRGSGKRCPTVIASDENIDDAIGVSFTNGRKAFYTRCKLTAYMGTHTAILPAGFHWNGADIPRLFWSLLGISPSDPRSLIASGFHDDGCERADIPQVIADATFVSLLRDFGFYGMAGTGKRINGVGRGRAVAMYVAVRAWSIAGRPATRLLKRAKRQCVGHE